MTRQKFPSEETGGYDPIPTHPEPLSPERSTVNPEEDSVPDEIPEDERPRPESE
jgi:hypothetical protein